MSGQLAPQPILQFLGTNGQFLVGGLLYTYQAGTTTPQTAYSDSALTQPLPNPCTLNAYGEPTTGSGTATPIWLNPSQSYKFYVTDSAGNPYQGYPVDNIQGPLTGFQSLLPVVNNTYDLGSSSFQWRTGYFGTSVLINGIPVPTYPQTAGELAQAVTPVNYTYPCGHAWRYLSAAQLSDVQAFTFTQDCTTALQNWINGAYASSVDAYLPGGGYLISNTLYVNQADQTYYRGKGFRIYGDGAGPVFVTPGSTGVGDSVMQATVDVVMLQYKNYLGGTTTSGNFMLERIRFQQTNASATSPVLQMDRFGENSYIKNCEVYQAGVGNGILLSEGTKGLIEQCNILNRDWLTPPGTRYGTGIAIGDAYSAGLMTVSKVTSRGFLYGFTVGTGSNALYSTGFYDCEVSNVTNGWYVYSGNYNTIIDHCYNDGGLTGTCVIDNGNATIVRDCWFAAGFAYGINGNGAGYGGVYAGNTFGFSNISSVVGVNIVQSGAYGGPGVTARDNYFATAGTSVAGQVGVSIAGIDPRVDGLSSNIFNPRGNWSGVGSYKIYDISTSSTGSPGTGVYGVDKSTRGAASVSTAYDYEYPLLSRGAISLGRNRTPLTNSAVSGRVINLGQESLYLVSPTATIAGASAIVGINDGSAVEGMRYTLLFVASSFTWAFATNSASMVVPSAGIVVPPAGGCYEFQMDKGNAYLVTATAYT